MTSVGFLGGGRVARILIGGWAHARALPSAVLVHEPDAAAFAALKEVAPGVRLESASQLAAADVVFVALHPPAIADALAAVRPALAPATIVVSLAPKVTLDALAALTGNRRTARMIPNAPSMLGLGYNPVAFAPAMDAGARAELARLFRPWGESPEVPEASLEAYALLTGMGPTYFWFQWQVLRELAVGMGLQPAACDSALRSMVHGSLATLLDGGLAPSAVMDLVPVKPLAGMESAVTAAYREALPALHARIKPERQAAAGRP